MSQLSVTTQIFSKFWAILYLCIHHYPLQWKAFLNKHVYKCKYLEDNLIIWSFRKSSVIIPPKGNKNKITNRYSLQEGEILSKGFRSHLQFQSVCFLSQVVLSSLQQWTSQYDSKQGTVMDKTIKVFSPQHAVSIIMNSLKCLVLTATTFRILFLSPLPLCIQHHWVQSCFFILVLSTGENSALLQMF